ncbi:UNVERIFIED_CONTAM: hypothetical protein Slati_0088500 [Sesamum latifolium]|uniref:Reverse transcriptase domain-containing protein n=1 Tax=Sesamum latifolium TaxID=2727402 RepID=A0AAW2Y8A3_9LAMI
MENPNHPSDKQKAVATLSGTQALQVIAETPPAPVPAGSTPVTLAQAAPSPRVTDPTSDPPRWSTSSDTSTEELSPALLGAIQQIVAAAFREHVSIIAPPGSHTVRHRSPRGRSWRRRPRPSAATRQKMGEPSARTLGGPPTVARPFRALSKGSRKLRKIELSLFVVRQKDNEPLKEYLQRFNAAALEVPSATQEVKASAFSQGLLDGDFFKSLAKQPVSKFDALLARAAKYINMEDAQAAKKESCGEKQKEIKEETPSKKPRIDTRDKKPPFQRVNAVYTPLTVPITQAFMAVEKKRVTDTPQEYVCWEKARGTGPYQKREGDKANEIRESSPERSPKERARQASGSKGDDNDVPRKGVIRSDRGRGYGGYPRIQFGRAECSRPQTSHNDALIITAVLADYEVGCIFIDSGSYADILFGEAYDQMQLGDVSLEKVNTSLYGFAGEVVHPRGMISLPLTMGAGTTRKTCMLKFLVVDVPSAYNVILGRPTLTAFQAVISIYHMKIKFPNPGGVGEVQSDHLRSRKCYVEAVRKGQKRNLTKITKGFPPAKREKKQWQKGLPRKWRHRKDLKGIDPKVITHQLNIDPGVKPVKQKKRHFGPEKDKVIQAEVDKLMAAGHIEEIQFPEWLSNVVLVPKPRGKWRMSIDFRDLNKAYLKDFYPLPRIDQLVDSTFGCELLSMMDASQGYHQIMLAPEDR